MGKSKKRTPPTAGLISWATQASVLQSFLPSIAFAKWTLAMETRPNAEVFTTVSSRRTLLWEWLLTCTQHPILDARVDSPAFLTCQFFY
jgi:hypothetical protein